MTGITSCSQQSFCQNKFIYYTFELYLQNNVRNRDSCYLHTVTVLQLSRIKASCIAMVLFREILNWVSKVIFICFGFALQSYKWLKKTKTTFLLGHLIQVTTFLASSSDWFIPSWGVGAWAWAGRYSTYVSDRCEWGHTFIPQKSPPGLKLDPSMVQNVT